MTKCHISINLISNINIINMLQMQRTVFLRYSFCSSGLVQIRLVVWASGGSIVLFISEKQYLYMMQELEFGYLIAYV